MMYLSQTIMLYTLNLHSAICQVFLNKTGIKREKRIQKYYSHTSSESQRTLKKKYISKLLLTFLFISHLKVNGLATRSINEYSP